MEEWIRQKVEALALDVDVYVDYVKGIVEDEDMELEERVESLIGILSGACEGAVSDQIVARELNKAQLVEQLTRLMQQQSEQAKQQAEARRLEIEMRELQILENEKKKAEEAKEQEKLKALARQTMSKEELLQREKIISEYGFSALTEYDDDGNVIGSMDKDAQDASLDGIAQNTNRVRVQQHQTAQREKMKKDHEKKVTREKELLEKDRLRKEKAKKRTMKREKQRGCG